MLYIPFKEVVRKSAGFLQLYHHKLAAKEVSMAQDNASEGLHKHRMSSGGFIQPFTV